MSDVKDMKVANVTKVIKIAKVAFEKDLGLSNPNIVPVHHNLYKI